MTPSLSLVIPSYEGDHRLRRLFAQLAVQTLPRERFEVIVVDDGSPNPPSLGDPAAQPFTFRLLHQKNGGAASARHRGAEAARAPLLVFLDDDMEVGPGFLAKHLKHHEDRAGDSQPLVVLGRMRGVLEGARAGLFERWHQEHLDRKVARVVSGELEVKGSWLFSGNVSMEREHYFAVGGFDVSLRRGHDVELGLRLKRAGAEFILSTECESVHAPDVHPISWWRARAALYGRIAHRVSLKHPDLPEADPWRQVNEMNALLTPFVQVAVRAPTVANRLAGAAIVAAHAVDRIGLEALACRGLTVAYTMDYFRALSAARGKPTTHHANASGV